MHHRASVVVGSSTAIVMSDARRSRPTTAIEATRLSRCWSVSGSRKPHATLSARRSSTARSARPVLVSRAKRTRPSSGLVSTLISRSRSRARKTRLMYPESIPSRARSSRTSAPSRPISHSVRHSTIGRPRPRNPSFSAPIRSATVRLKARTALTAGPSMFSDFSQRIVWCQT